MPRVARPPDAAMVSEETLAHADRELVLTMPALREKVATVLELVSFCVGYVFAPALLRDAAISDMER